MATAPHAIAPASATAARRAGSTAAGTATSDDESICSLKLTSSAKIACQRLAERGSCRGLQQLEDALRRTANDSAIAAHRNGALHEDGMARDGFDPLLRIEYASGVMLLECVLALTHQRLRIDAELGDQRGEIGCAQWRGQILHHVGF